MAALSTFDLSDGLVAVSNLKYKSPTLKIPFILEKLSDECWNIEKKLNRFHVQVFRKWPIHHIWIWDYQILKFEISQNTAFENFHLVRWHLKVTQKVWLSMCLWALTCSLRSVNELKTGNLVCGMTEAGVSLYCTAWTLPVLCMWTKQFVTLYSWYLQITI